MNSRSPNEILELSAVLEAERLLVSLVMDTRLKFVRKNASHFFALNHVQLSNPYPTKPYPPQFFY